MKTLEKMREFTLLWSETFSKLFHLYDINSFRTKYLQIKSIFRDNEKKKENVVERNKDRII